jgi:hypothetical protein
MTDLFGDEAEPQQTDPLIGLTVDLQDACLCGTYLVVIGPGAGPHVASLRCKSCDRHRGWLSRESHRFINETVNRFGCTTEPIKVRRAA